MVKCQIRRKQLVIHAQSMYGPQKNPWICCKGVISFQGQIGCFFRWTKYSSKKTTLSSPIRMQILKLLMNNYLSHNKMTALSNSIGWCNQFWASLRVFFLQILLCFPGNHAFPHSAWNVSGTWIQNSGTAMNFHTCHAAPHVWWAMQVEIEELMVISYHRRLLSSQGLRLSCLNFAWAEIINSLELNLLKPLRFCWYNITQPS